MHQFSRLFLIMVMVVCWTQPHHQVHCSEDKNKHPDGSRYCVDLSRDDSSCSNDPIGALKLVRNKGSLNDFNVGVAQTIDGTEEEKNSIRNVLSRMNEYWYDEVLSNNEYAEVRSSCKNKNKLCAFWATVGECESNRYVRDEKYNQYEISDEHFS